MDQPPIGALIGIGICVIFSAVFSGTETALTGLTDRMTLQLMERGGRAARVLAAWRDHPNHVLSTLLIGNNIVNIAASVLSVRVAVWVFQKSGPNAQSYADVAAVISTTLLLLIFGEISPKTFAKHNAMRIAVPLMWFVRAVSVPLFPIAWVMTHIGRLVVKVFGGKTTKDGPSVTEEDIEYMIELGAREQVFEEQSRGDLLEAAIEFGEIVAKEVMIARTQALALDEATPIKEALEQLIRRGHSRVPVYSESIDKIVGVLYAKDLLRAIARGSIEGQSIESLMRKEPFFVPESQRIAETLREMQRRRVHLGVVVDEFGGFSGIVTIEDIIEEIVGEIRDEYDREEERVRKLDEGTYLVNALISIRDLEEILDLDYPEEGDYDTLGGFMVSAKGRVPEVGEVIKWNSLILEVVASDERHVEQVKITLASEKSRSDEPTEATA